MTAVIKSSQEIGSIMKEGRRTATPFFSLIYKELTEEGSGEGRVAYIAGRKNGNAVWRNKAKRKLRAAWQQQEGVLAHYDILLVAHRRIVKYGANEIAQTLNDALVGQGLLQ